VTVDLLHPAILEITLHRFILGPEFQPVNPKAQCDLGDVLVDSELYGEAAKAFDRALELDPGSFRTINALAAVSLREEQYDQARGWLKRLEHAPPEFARSSHINQAILAMRDGDYPTADKMLRKVLTDEAESPVAHYYSGVLAERKGEWKEAGECLAEALRLAPNHRAFQGRKEASEMVRQGLQELAQENLKKSLKAFKAALRVDSRHELAYFLIAEVLSGLGYKEEAERNRSRARQLAPDLFTSFSPELVRGRQEMKEAD